jgi:hypothetical protein
MKLSDRLAPNGEQDTFPHESHEVECLTKVRKV